MDTSLIERQLENERLLNSLVVDLTSRGWTLVPCLCLDVSTGELTMEMHEQAIPRDWMMGL
jgi:hypothetical protein